MFVTILSLIAVAIIILSLAVRRNLNTIEDQAQRKQETEKWKRIFATVGLAVIATTAIYIFITIGG